MSVNESRVGLFGASSDGGRTAQALEREYGLRPYAFFDNDSAKWDTLTWGLPVMQPTRDNLAAVDAILISSVHVAAILRQLNALVVDCKVYVDMASLALDLDLKYIPAQEVSVEEAVEAVPIENRARVSERLKMWEQRYIDSKNIKLSSMCSNTIAVTIITADFAAQAKAMACSFLSVHPSARVKICMIADMFVEGLLDFFEDARIDLFLIGDVGVPPLHDRYGPYEYCCAVRPYVFKYILQKYPACEVLGLDSDILFLEPIDPILDLLEESSFVLTPHFIDRDMGLGNDYRVARVGIFNGGLYALKNCEETLAFLDWHAVCLRNHCWPTLSLGLFLDQKWLDFVPVYFPGAGICRDYGCNVAPYNLPERSITEDVESRQLLVNGHLLLFYHFSSFNFEDIGYSFPMERLSEPSDNPSVWELLMAYRIYVIKLGYYDWKYHRTRHQLRQLASSVKGAVQDAYILLNQTAQREVLGAARFPDLGYLLNLKSAEDLSLMPLLPLSDARERSVGPVFRGVLLVEAGKETEAIESAFQYSRVFPGASLEIIYCGDIHEAHLIPPTLGIECTKNSWLDVCQQSVEQVLSQYDEAIAYRAIKPAIIQSILEREQNEGVFFFGTDVTLSRGMETQLSTYGLNDVILFSAPFRSSIDSLCDLAKRGLYSTDLIAVQNSREGLSFCNWWFERTRTYCVNDLVNGIYYEKKWLDLVPVLFPSTAIITQCKHHV